jgi:integrase
MERDKLIFLVAFECGLRASEIGMINNEDFNEQRNELYCKRLKGSKNNTIRLTQSTAKLLKKFTKNMDPEDPIFTTQKGNVVDRFLLDKLTKKYFALAKLPKDKANFHTMKHTCAIYLAEAGVDLLDLQYLLGHARVENTLIYFTYTTKRQDALYKKIGR